MLNNDTNERSRTMNISMLIVGFIVLVIISISRHSPFNIFDFLLTAGVTQILPWSVCGFSEKTSLIYALTTSSVCALASWIV